MLNILEHSDLKALRHNTAESIHVLAEAIKLGFADRNEMLGDPDFVPIDVEKIISKEFANERHRLITDKAGEYLSVEFIEADNYPGNTSHFSVMDSYGNAALRLKLSVIGLAVELW